MPLPDADKRSPRVYTLLQNQDLENITADTLADVADPISIEEANEDELRRLCLVAFARMVTKGSFDGWLTGGGNEFNGELTKYNWDGDGDRVRVLALPPYGNGNLRTLNQVVVDDNQLVLFPFIAPNSATISAVDLYVQTASEDGALNVGFYSDNEGVPEQFLGEFVMDATSTGDVEQTTSSDDVVTIRGNQYWISFYGDNLGATKPRYGGLTNDGLSSPLCVGAYGTTAILNAVFFTGASSGNATITDWTLFEPAGMPMPNVGVTW